MVIPRYTTLPFEGDNQKVHGLSAKTSWHYPSFGRKNEVYLRGRDRMEKNEQWLELPIDRYVPATRKFEEAFVFKGKRSDKGMEPANEWMTKTTFNMLTQQLIDAGKLVDRKIELFNVACALIDEAKTYEDLCEVWPEAKLAAGEVATEHNPNPLAKVGKDQLEALRANAEERGVRAA